MTNAVPTYLDDLQQLLHLELLESDERVLDEVPLVALAGCQNDVQVLDGHFERLGLQLAPRDVHLQLLDVALHHGERHAKRRAGQLLEGIFLDLDILFLDPAVPPVNHDIVLRKVLPTRRKQH